MLEEEANLNNEEETLEDNEQSDEQDDLDTEGEGEETSESSKSDTVTFTKDELDKRDKSIRKDQDKRWKDRLKGDDEDQDGGKTDTPEVIDRLDRADLRAEGIKDEQEQKVVLEYARNFKIGVIEALNRPGVQAELKALRDKRSIPAPSGRTNKGRSGDDIDYLVRQYRKGTLLSPDQFKKVQRHLRGQK